MITKKDLKLEGYTEWESNKYQKCIKDRVGKRYFINIEYYDLKEELKNYNIPKANLKGYTIKTQFQNTLIQNKEICPNIEIDSGLLTIIEIEQLILKIWLTLNLPYYEEF